MKSTLITTLFLLFSTIALAQNNSGAFESSTENNKATVIFYRTSSFGAIYSYNVSTVDKFLVRSKYKTFYSEDFKAGNIAFNAKNLGGKSDLKLNLVAGNIYFVKCAFAPSFLIPKPRLKLLNEKQAERVMSKHFIIKGIEENKVNSKKSDL